MWAMGLSKVVLACDVWQRAAQDISAVSHWLKMGWIHTMPSPTEMIKFKSFGNRPDQQFVGEPMHSYLLSVQPVTSIAKTVQPPGPKPAAIRAILIDESPEPGHSVAAPGLSFLGRTSALPSSVMEHTPSSRLMRLTAINNGAYPADEAHRNRSVPRFTVGHAKG